MDSLAQSEPIGEKRVDPRISDTRRRVLRAAFELIAEDGFAGATIERIAARSGVSRTTIYRRWEDPSLIYFEALHPIGSLFQLEETDDLRRDLIVFGTHIADRLNDPRYARTLAAIVERSLRDPKYGEWYRAIVDDSLRSLKRRIEKGVADGVLYGDRDYGREIHRFLGPFVFHRLIGQATITQEDVEEYVDGWLCVNSVNR